MFSKKNTVKMNYEGDGFSGSSTSIPLTDGKLFNYLREALKRHGELVITHIRENEIYLTTSRTIEYREMESKVDEIGDLIRDYVKNK